MTAEDRAALLHLLTVIREGSTIHPVKCPGCRRAVDTIERMTTPGPVVDS